MFERFTDQARRTVVLAVEECRRLGHAQIDPEHLLLALLMQYDAMASRLLINFGVDAGALRRDVEHAMDSAPSHRSTPGTSRSTRKPNRYWICRCRRRPSCSTDTLVPSTCCERPGGKRAHLPAATGTEYASRLPGSSY